MTVSQAQWNSATAQADPLADRTVATLIGPWSDDSGARGPGMARLSEATRLMAGWTSNASLASWPTGQTQADPSVVAALRAYVDTARRLPEWADAAKVERAERVFMDYGPLSCTLLFCASLPQCYVLPNLSEVLHIAGQLEAHTEHRIRQTAAMVFPVMMEGGLLHEDGAGVAQVLKVRLIHATIRHLILRGSPEQAGNRIEPWPSPGRDASMQQALMSHGWDVQRQGLPCNQLELAYTLLTFSYVCLKGMRTLGQPLSRQDEEAYLHAWNVMGHVLGVRAELMAHSMEEAAAMFGDLQARAWASAPTPDVRVGLGRALMNTMGRSIGLPVIRNVPVPLTRWLIGPQSADAVGVNEQVGWLTRATFWIGRSVIQLIDRLARLAVPGFSLTRMFTRVIGYHLLTRFLLDQTVPLGLPDSLLQPMCSTVAAWRDDPRAPRWVNWVEDRLTTRGAWAPRQIDRRPG